MSAAGNLRKAVNAAVQALEVIAGAEGEASASDRPDYKNALICSSAAATVALERLLRARRDYAIEQMKLRQPELELSQADLFLVIAALRVTCWVVDETRSESGDEAAQEAMREVSGQGKRLAELAAKVDEHLLDLPVDFGLAGAGS